MNIILQFLHKLSDISINILFLVVLPFILLITIFMVLTRKIYINILNKCVIKLNSE